jgi:hypothetical protein
MGEMQILITTYRVSRQIRVRFKVSVNNSMRGLFSLRHEVGGGKVVLRVQGEE